MTRQEFKTKYLKNAFFWINEKNHLKIQKIMQEFDINCHTGKGVINWHDGFRNLVTFEPDEHHSSEYYQKVDMWLPDSRYGEPKNITQFFNDYETQASNKRSNNKY